MDFLPLAAAVALIWKVVDFARFIRAKDVDSSLTQAVVWVVGTAVTFLLAGTDWAGGIVLGDVALGLMSWQSLLLVGLSLGSTASALVDFKTAIDNTDSAAIPRRAADVARKQKTPRARVRLRNPMVVDRAAPEQP